MKILMLAGVHCNDAVWDRLRPYMKDFDVTYLSYPHVITCKASTVSDITAWVSQNIASHYDMIIGHSMGGLVAIKLLVDYHITCNHVVYLDTNLLPAEAFYRNLMTPTHMDAYGSEVLAMIKNESQYYTDALLSTLQDTFDYTDYIREIKQPVHAIYGDRSDASNPNLIKDLNLPDDIIKKLDIRFIKDACHMIMIENPRQLLETIIDIQKGI